MQTGTIKSISGLGTSIVTLTMEMDDGEVQVVHGEGRLLSWALGEAFDCAWDAPGHRIDFGTDDMGMMTHFTPAEAM